jgi:phage terminase large subunit-like protein
MTFDHSKYYYDEAAVDKVVKFITGYCTHTRGQKGGLLIELDKWQIEDIIKPIFGIKRKVDKLRKHQVVYVEIGKGNAKSTLAAAFALYFLGLDGQIGAEVYSVASTLNQASIVFDTAKDMVNNNPELGEHFGNYKYSIIKKNTNSFYKVLSADPVGKHGLNPSAIIFDELHEQDDPELYETIEKGRVKRPECILIALTTAGQNKQSICYKLHEKTLKINKGIIKDESFYGIIYAAPEKDNISKLTTWKKANPGLGTILDIENFKRNYESAMTISGSENSFRRLHLNQWVDAYDYWISDAKWIKCNKGREKEELIGLECYGGMDLATTGDFNSFVLLFPNSDTGVADILSWHWLPSDRKDDRIRKQNIDFNSWVKDGYIILHSGEMVDHDLILNDIIELSKKYIIKSIAYDRKFAAPIVNRLEDADIQMNAFDQSLVNISYPTTELDNLVKKKMINHYDNPVMRWELSNVLIYRGENELIKVTKKNSPDKVDGVVALIMAIGEWVQFQMEGDNESVYEKRGVITIDEI